MKNTDRTLADELSQEALLNCYLREVALPNQCVAFTPTPMQGYLVSLKLTHQQRALWFHVHAMSLTGNYRYLSLPAWEPQGPPLGLADLAQTLLDELSQLEGRSSNSELHRQILNSQSVLAGILSQTPASRPLPDAPVAAFIKSEQALTIGHRFHPTPKARQGMTMAELAAYTPEHGGRFQWHCFSVIRESCYRNRGEADLQAFIRRQWMPELDLGSSRALLPVHPWQARYLLQQPSVCRLMARDALRYHGSAGRELLATSSVRTCYHPELEFFVKGSLNLRLTNCVRKNALYELESAVRLSELLDKCLADNPITGFTLLAEPAYQTIDDEGIPVELKESFSFIARKNPFQSNRLDVRPIVAGALFAPHPKGRSLIHWEIAHAAHCSGRSYFDVAANWFQRLVETLAEPVLRLYFESGVVLEPHLQNCIIGLDDQGPTHFYYRDLEGTKLLPEYWPASELDDLDDRARRSVYYSADQGWNRLCYCLFVNNLAQAVFHMGNGDELLERHLWRVLAFYLDGFRQRHSASRIRIDQLLNTCTLPNKANLLVRYRRQADREAIYVPMTNPISRAFNEAVSHSNLLKLA